MKPTTASTALQRYVGGLGGSRSEATEDLRFSSQIPPPGDAADTVLRRLREFETAIATATNTRFDGLLNASSRVGSRDGALAIPSEIDGGELVRPAYVSSLLETGMLAVSNAHGIAESYRAEFNLASSVADKSAVGRLGEWRQALYNRQLGLLALISLIVTSGFSFAGFRLWEWSTTVDRADGVYSVPHQNVVGATAVITALGMTVGFFRAVRDRVRFKARQSERSEHYVEVGALADADPVVIWLGWIGLALSLGVGWLISIGASTDSTGLIGNSLPHLIGWVLWGGLLYGAAVLLTQTSQHWLNLLPAEIDLTDIDDVTARENAESARLGLQHVERVLQSQYEFVTVASLRLISGYYSANISSRRSSRTGALDAFVHADGDRARDELEKYVSRLCAKGTGT